MVKKINMIGLKFGRLTVVEEVPPKKKGRPMYKCLCECGGEKIVTGASLRSGEVKSCGCIRKEMGNSHALIEMVGKKFNMLTVVEEVEKNKRGQRMFKCLCDCGNLIIAEGCMLRKGEVKSCGCLYNSRKVENKKKDIIGKRFGKLVVKREVGGEKKDTLFECLCDCGKVTVEKWSAIIGGKKSCGCLHHEQLMKRNTTHGGSNDRLYTVWMSMKGRCYDINDAEYKWYGGRGIEVCAEWRNDYTMFKKFMMECGYDENAKRGECTIERIDVNGNYCPENCCIATIQQQAYNKTNSHLEEYNGEVKTIAEWAKEYNVPYNLVFRRFQRGWTMEEALKKPLRVAKKYKGGNEEHTLKEWSEILGIRWSTLRAQLRKGTLDIDYLIESRRKD